MKRQRAGWLLLILLAACGTAVGGGSGDGGGADATAPDDASADDARSPDGGADDAAAFDARSDAPPGDASNLDGSALDASDAFASDAGPTDAALVDAPADAPVDAPVDAADAAVPPGKARVRLALVAPDVAASDFCVAREGAPFVAPHMASAGVAAGLRYPSASEYVEVTPGARYSVRVVAAGAVDCATPLAGVADALTGVLADMDAVTVVAAGEVAAGAPHPLALQALVDATAGGAVGTMTARVFHASPDLGTVDFGASSALLYAPQFTGLTFGVVPTAASVAAGGAPVDAKGYFNSPRDREHFSVRQGASDVVRFGPDVWSLVSTFLVGKVGSATAPLGFLSCRDFMRESNHLSNCIVQTGAPEQSPLRLVHVAPGAPALDFCVKEAMAAAYPLVPVLRAAGAAAGVPFGSASRHFAFPGRFGEALSVRVIAASAAADCTQPALATYGGDIGPDSSVAVYQTAFAPAVPVFGAQVSQPTGRPAAGATGFSVVPAIPGDVAIDVYGTITGGAAVKWATNLRPGRLFNGYFTTAAGDYQVAINQYPTATVLLRAPITLAVDVPGTGFLYGSAPGTRALLRCVDVTPAAGVYVVPCTN